MDTLVSSLGFVFESYGARVRVRASTPSILDAIQDHLPPLSRLIDSEDTDYSFSILTRDGGGDPEEERAYQLYRCGRLLMHAASLHIVLDELESLLHATVAFESSPKLFVHAGVVGWQECAIIIPGRSMSGKTTLVAELVRAGATYYSDEFAVFDQDGYVYAYPRPLSLRGAQGAHQIKCSAEELGGRIGTNPLPVALVIATQYDEHARWQPQVLSPGQAVLHLFDNTIDAIRRPQCAISTFAQVVANCLAISSPRPSCEQVVPSLLALCEQASHRLVAAHQTERSMYGIPT